MCVLVFRPLWGWCSSSTVAIGVFVGVAVYAVACAHAQKTREIRDSLWVFFQILRIFFKIRCGRSNEFVHRSMPSSTALNARSDGKESYIQNAGSKRGLECGFGEYVLRPTNCGGDGKE